MMVLIFCVAVSAAYNAIRSRYLQSRYPVPGKFYAVNGSVMHIYCIGSGSPTVVLESGRGDDWLYWQKVQPDLAKATRVCSYDRAGLGWSDPQPGLRDARNIATQLHALLQQAGEAGPFVMVGASAGGLYVREFVATHPTEIAGIVFVDASSPEQVQELPYGKDSDAGRKTRHREAVLEWIKEASGWSRLSGQCTGEVEKGLESYALLARAGACRPSVTFGELREWDEFWHSAEEAAGAPCCGDLPLVVISQDPDRPKPGWSAQSIAANPIWNSLQERLKNLSPRSRRIIARTSGHHIMIDRPDAVIAGVGQLVNEIRHPDTSPKYGTTSVQ
jgi:pimeloyl-ACP methyl ester carboxylesterase